MSFKHNPVAQRALLAIHLWENLNAVVKAAGGMGYTFEDLGDMSAADLILQLAPNRVRFVYRDPSEEA